MPGLPNSCTTRPPHRVVVVDSEDLPLNSSRETLQHYQILLMDLLMKCLVTFAEFAEKQLDCHISMSTPATTSSLVSMRTLLAVPWALSTLWIRH